VIELKWGNIGSVSRLLSTQSHSGSTNAWNFAFTSRKTTNFPFSVDSYNLEDLY